MGGKAKAAQNTVGMVPGVGGIIGGKGPLGGVLGGMMNGTAGSNAGNPILDSPAYSQAQSRVETAGNPELAKALANYASGNETNAQGIQSIRDMNFTQPGAADEAYAKLATDPLTGSKFATNEVMNNPILGQTFGKGGTLDRTTAEEQQLANTGYQLQPEDKTAYGQASGQIARNFGKAESGLAQAMADRGLSSSGVANQQFMTSQGNKQEQLGQLQTDIAQKRMQTNLDRLGQTRSFLSNLSAQGAQDINQQYGRQLAGRQAGQADIQTALGANVAAANQGNEQFDQMQKTRKPGLFEALQTGITGAVSAAPTIGAKAAMGA